MQKMRLPPSGISPHAAGIFADMSIDGPEIGTLVVVMDRAKNLPNLRTMGKQDPYAAARLGKEAKKTETDRRGGQTPKWDQELRFIVHDALDYHKLKVSVFNDDKRTDLIGECWIQLDEVIRQGGGQADGWHSLNCKGRYAGEIRIELTFYDTRPKPEKPQRKLAANMPTSSEEDPTQMSQEEGPSAQRVPGPRQIPAVKRRPLPNPSAQAIANPAAAAAAITAATSLTSSIPAEQPPPLHSHSTGSIPTSHHYHSASDYAEEPHIRAASDPAPPDDPHSLRPVRSLPHDVEYNSPAEFSSPLPEPIDTRDSHHQPSYGSADHHSPVGAYHEVHSSYDQFDSAPEVYENLEPYTEFTDDPYALQAVYGHQEEEQLADARIPTNDRVSALSGSEQPPVPHQPMARALPSRLTAGHMRNAYSESVPNLRNGVPQHFGLQEEAREDLYQPPVQPIPKHHQGYTQETVQSWDDTYSRPDQPQLQRPHPNYRSSMPPAPPAHERTAQDPYSNIYHNTAPLAQPTPGYNSLPRPRPRAPYPDVPTATHRLSYSNLPDEFGREDMLHRQQQPPRDYPGMPERRHSGDAVADLYDRDHAPQHTYRENQQQPPQWDSRASRDNCGPYPPASRPDPRFNGPPRANTFGTSGQPRTYGNLPPPTRSQVVPPGPDPRMRGPPPNRGQYQPDLNQPPANRYVAARQPQPQQRNDPGIQGSQQHYGRQQPPQQQRPGGYSQQQGPPQQQQQPLQSLAPPQQQFKTPRKSVSPQTSSQSMQANGGSSVPFSPDSFDTFNPRASQSPQGPPEIEPPRAFREPAPMYANTAHPPAAAAPRTTQHQHTQSADMSGRTPSGRVVTSSGRVIDPSDHIPSTAWAPEPDRKEKRPTVAVNVKNRFGPRGAPIQPQPAPVNARAGATAGQPVIRTSRPLAPASENARFTTHGISYSPAVPPKVAVDNALQEELRKIDLGPSPTQAVDQRYGGSGPGSRPRRSRFGA